MLRKFAFVASVLALGALAPACYDDYYAAYPGYYSYYPAYGYYYGGPFVGFRHGVRFDHLAHERAEAHEHFGHGGVHFAGPGFTRGGGFHGGGGGFHGGGGGFHGGGGHGGHH
jgi:hypothetical protein